MYFGKPRKSCLDDAESDLKKRVLEAEEKQLRIEKPEN
jgi:hypothetical protein